MKGKSSAKLFLFYSKIKLGFEKEACLDFVKNATVQPDLG